MSGTGEKPARFPLWHPFYIPTYRRAGLLEKRVNAVLRQGADDLTPFQCEQAESVISDNALSDETPQCLAPSALWQMRKCK